MKPNKIIKTALNVIKFLIIAIVVIAIICLITLPKLQGYVIAGGGALLIVNLLIAMVMLKNNYNKK